MTTNFVRRAGRRLLGCDREEIEGGATTAWLLDHEVARESLDDVLDDDPTPSFVVGVGAAARQLA